jgi:hypothetical protein
MYEISDEEARRFADAGPNRPLAEWTMAEYAAAIDAADVSERWKMGFEANHRRRMQIVGRLLGS